jgi:hypothetical protein
MKLRLLLGIVALFLGAIVALLSVILYKISKGFRMLFKYLGLIEHSLQDIKINQEISLEANDDTNETSTPPGK